MIINRNFLARWANRGAWTKPPTVPTPGLQAPPVTAPAESLAKTQRPLWQVSLLALPLVALGWIATLAGVALVSDAAPARYVLLPPETLLSDLPEASLVGAGRHWLVLASDQPGFTAALYQAGAVLVLPAGLEPCGPKRRSGLKYT